MFQASQTWSYRVSWCFGGWFGGSQELTPRLRHSESKRKSRGNRLLKTWKCSGLIAQVPLRGGRLVVGVWLLLKRAAAAIHGQIQSPTYFIQAAGLAKL